jgi:hypothetical protein
MDDAFGVGGVQSVGDLDAEIEHHLDFHRLAADAVLQRLALEQFHGNKSPALGSVNLVDSANVGMVKSRGSLGFALKTAERQRRLGDVFG